MHVAVVTTHLHTDLQYEGKTFMKLGPVGNNINILHTYFTTTGK